MSVRAPGRDEGLRPLRVEELGRVPYDEALALQRARVEDVRRGLEPETLFLLEHPHVITLGSSARAEHVLLAEPALRERGIELRRVGRGGDVTLHGPGQLVGYPILDLRPDRKDLHRYLRDLEAVLIEALRSFGIESVREPGLTGVWAGGAKIAAIGVRVTSGWITSHGFALNVAPDLADFEAIVPCGIQGRSVTSMARELGGPPATRDVRGAVVSAFARRFSRRLVP